MTNDSDPASVPAFVPSADSARRKRLHVALVVGLSCASLVPIWSVTYFPSQNGPGYLLIVKIFREFSNPQYNYSNFYELRWHVLPYLTHNLLLYTFSFFSDMLTAQKLAISVYTILLPLSVFYFVRTVARCHQTLGYLSFLLIFNYPLFRGYHNFVIAIPLYFFALSYWLRHKNTTAIVRLAAINCLVLLVFLSHASVFLLLLGTLVLWTLFETRSVWACFQTLMRSCIPSLFFLADFLVLNATSAHWIDDRNVRYLPLHWTVENFIRQTLYPLSETGLIVTLVPFVFLAAVVSWATVRNRLRPFQHSGVANRLLLLFLSIVVAYFAVPYQLGGWHHVNNRLAPFAFVTGIAYLGTLPRLPLERTLTTMTVTSTVVVYTLLTVELQRLDAVVADYVSGIDNVPRNTAMLPMMGQGASPKFGLIRPLAHAYDYYPLFNGGANGFGMSRYNTIVPVWYKSYPVGDMFPRYDPRSPNQSLDRISKTYGYVVMWGCRDELVSQFRGQGFRTAYDQGPLLVLNNMREAATHAHTLSTTAD